MALQIPNLGQIASSHPVIYEGFRRIVQNFNDLAEKIGADPAPAPGVQTRGQTVQPPSQPASVSVQISAGSFYATIGPPANANPAIQYYLEASKNPLFPVGATISYSFGSLNTFHSVIDGSAAWYFRARCKYQTSLFGPYAYVGTQQHPQPVTTGAIAQSGNLILKNIGQARGIVSNPTTSSTSYSMMPDMSVQITTKGNRVFLSFTGSVANTNASANTFFQIWRDGVPLGKQSIIASPIGNQNMTTALTFIDMDENGNPPVAGTHVYTVQWRVTAGTSTGNLTDRSLQAVELG